MSSNDKQSEPKDATQRELRKRQKINTEKSPTTAAKTTSEQRQSDGDKCDDKTMEASPKNEPIFTNKLQNSLKHSKPGSENLYGSYWLTRIVIVRYMGFIYFVAYLVSLHQNKQLLGKNGLLPANLYLNNVRNHVGSTSSWSLMSVVPTLLWFVDYESDLNFWLDVIAWTGLVIASFMIITGAGNWPLLLLQWLLYHSLVNVGQRWFSFGWESQVLETGFLTAFLCPMLSLSSLPKSTPPSRVIIFAYRWLIFRIMLGAGLIKIRGDKCWLALTCMNYHYETQPVPNPLSYVMHQSPELFHKFEVMVNHFVELVAPFLLLIPRKLCIIGGIIQILFQVLLILSGNLSFLNWLTILPSLACFDDASLSWMFCAGIKSKAISHNLEISKATRTSITCLIRRTFNISFGILIAYLSIPVVQNLLSSQQAMNTSFDPLRLVNTYGAFGSVTKKRTEVIFLGTNSTDPESPHAVWEEYQFKCKPGDPLRWPCVISPYHYRLDWLMWFAAFQNYNHNPWLVHLAVKFLANDEETESLIAYNPFHGRPPPRFVKADHYRYIFTKIGSPEASEGHWWNRKKIGPYLPIVALDSLQPMINKMGWSVPTAQFSKVKM